MTKKIWWSPDRARVEGPRCFMQLHGRISGVGWASGDRVVVGHWDRSPIGPFFDVMWADASHKRTLLVDHALVSDFITAVYDFDEVRVDPSLAVDTTPARQLISGERMNLDLQIGRGVRFPPRPRWVTEWIERPLAKVLLGVETHGVSSTGVVETYRARRLHRVIDGCAQLDGNDLGALRAPKPTCGFGFSEPPPFASITEVTSFLLDPTGRLDTVVRSIQGETK